MTIEESDYIQAAKDIFVNDDLMIIDPEPAIKLEKFEGETMGAWVQAWVWIDRSEIS